MEDFQIVFEAPQAGQTKKKRARLVTSCDHCRLKKIKCIQPRDASKCEACATARVACRFRDREQYFAERGRLMSRHGSPSCNQNAAAREPNAEIALSILESHAGRLSNSPSVDSASPSPVTPQRPPHHHPSYSWPPPESYGSPSTLQSPCVQIPVQQSWQPYTTSPSPHLSPDSSPASYGSGGLICSAPSQGHGSQPPPLLPLFDPQWPERPNPTLMMHFIQTYFDHYGSSFPCLAYDETIRQFLDQTLSPLIAAGIAALAAWYSDLPEVVRRGVADVAGAYCAHAQALVARGQQTYSLEAVHGLILLAWAEYKRARMQDFCSHVKKAKHIADHVGLASGALLQAAGSEYERNIVRSTWAVLKQLILTADAWTA